MQFPSTLTITALFLGQLVASAPAPADPTPTVIFGPCVVYTYSAPDAVKECLQANLPIENSTHLKTCHSRIANCFITACGLPSDIATPEEINACILAVDQDLNAPHPPEYIAPVVQCVVGGFGNCPSYEWVLNLLV